MRILYIKLVNFSSIYTAMNATTIEISLREAKNKLCLLTGPTGSGKTSLLSCLTPFATLGNLDVRNDIPLIRIKKEGYKEIIIEDEQREYCIRHFYTPVKDRHTIKSYIQKDGEELNPNGNVRSFEEIVRQELDIEIDYLKLIRLGSNVKNLITLKGTDRKVFMGKILDEVDIYLQLLKKVSSDIRQLKTLSSHTLDKLNKIKITDSFECDNTINSKKERLQLLKTSLETIQDTSATLAYQLKSLGSYTDMTSELKLHIKEQQKIEKALHDLGSANDAKTMLNEMEKQETSINKLKITITSSVNKRTLLLEQLDDLFHNVREVETLLRDTDDEDELKAFRTNILELKETISVRDEQFKVFKPAYTKEELEDIIILLKIAHERLSTIYEFGEKPLKKVCHLLLKNNDDLSSYINRKRKKRKQYSESAVLTELLKRFHIMPDILKITPECKSASCIAYKLWKGVYETLINTPDEEIEDEDFYTYMEISYTTIKEILQSFEKKKDIIARMPTVIHDIFLAQNLFKRISKCERIYDIPAINNELSLITEYTIYEEDKKRLHLMELEYDNKLRAYKRDYFMKRRKELQKKIDATRSDIETEEENISSWQQTLSKLQETHQLYTEILEFKEHQEEVTVKIQELKTSISTYQSLSEELSVYQKKKQVYEIEIENITKEINQLTFQLKEYKKLKKELERFTKKQEEATLIQRSLGSKEGIPLVYIDMYLHDTEKLANDLLDITFHGGLRIGKMDIYAEDFLIPYYKNGKMTKDVRYASQGEQACISAAVSFALSHQRLSRYNIPLLDELDSGLDTEKRGHFIKILDRYSELTNGQQMFAITHNNQYSMYPVDLIDMNNHHDPNNKLVNPIIIKKE